MFSIDRKPVVAGSFYSANPAELIHQLKNCFDDFKNNTYKNAAAIIVPHAGYAYSGKVAASAYSLIDKHKEYNNIFIIGSSHHVAFRGASVYNQGHYKTPLGILPVNLEIANDLIKQHKNITYNQAAHAEEHTIEVQLPFLQYQIKHINAIIPIIIGVREPTSCKAIAKALQPYFNKKNLFVFSTDFSHYPNDKNAHKIDASTSQAICSNKPENLIATIKSNEKKKITNLYTSLCGWSSVLTLMYLTCKSNNYKYSNIKYMTSAEALHHDHKRVVGYQSILIERINEEPDTLSEKEKRTLLILARKAIEKHLSLDSFSEEEEYNGDTDFNHLNSAFVSVYVSGQLRGCIGQFDATSHLNTLVQELAVSAAFSDSRFSAIQQEELAELSIELSVLTPLKRINQIDEIILGKHGVYLKKDGHKGTFLPQVATKTGWTIEEFLGHLAKDKAHIGWKGWCDAEIYIFEAVIFSD